MTTIARKAAEEIASLSSAQSLLSRIDKEIGDA